MSKTRSSPERAVNGSPRIVVIGGSQGAIEALLQIVPVLPANLPAAIFVVVHIPVDATSYLPNLLTRAGNLRAEVVRKMIFSEE